MDAVIRIIGNASSIHPDDAVGGLSSWRALRHFKLDVRVDTDAVARCACHFAEVLIDTFNGGENLGIADVLFFSHIRTKVHHVHNDWKGVDFEVPVACSLQTTNGILHSLKAPGVRDG